MRLGRNGFLGVATLAIAVDIGRKASQPSHTEHSSLQAIEFNACSRWSGDVGVRGKMYLGNGAAFSLDLEPCGLARTHVSAILNHLQKLLVVSLQLGLDGFAAKEVRSEYLKDFAVAAAISLKHSCVGSATCDSCPVRSESNQGDQPVLHGDAHHVAIERALLVGLAAASIHSANNEFADASAAEIFDDDAGDSLISPIPVEGRPDHITLASVTEWLRVNEHRLEFDGHRQMRSKCLAQGELHGYECMTFTYGSTYYTSWLQVMRFEEVSRALAALTTPKMVLQASDTSTGSQRNEVVVLGSTLGWQVLWTALTFGVRTVGYELMEHRVEAARAAAFHAGLAADGLVEFRHADALKSDLSKAAVIFITDLIWEDYLCTLMANHAKKALLDSTDSGKGVVIISNKYRSWKKARFQNIGEVAVPVSWQESQTFYFWTYSARAR